VASDSSESTSTSLVEVVASDTKVKISAMVLHPSGEYVFCGKDDGSIALYGLKTGAQIRTLYSHKSLVCLLTWWPQSDLITSVDVSNRIFTWNLKKSEEESWVAAKMLFQSRLDCGKSIIQVLPGEAAGKFVLSTRESDHLWSIDGWQEDERTYTDRSGIRKRIQHQHSPLHMVCIEGAAARIYAWSDWSEVASVSLTIDIKGLQLKTVTPYISGHRRRILLELSELDGSAGTRGLHLLDAASFSIETDPSKEVVLEAAEVGADGVSIREEVGALAAVSVPLLGPQLAALAHHFAHVIGLNDAGKLIFLDTRSWVCSVDLEASSNSPVSYSRHFFVPYDWLSGTRVVICVVTHRQVLFARTDDVAIVKGGLEYVEKVNVEVEGAETKGAKGLLAVG
jgi:hypothetical protein